MTADILFTDSEYKILVSEAPNYGINILKAYEYPEVKWSKSVELEFDTVIDLVLLLRNVFNK